MQVLIRHNHDNCALVLRQVFKTERQTSSLLPLSLPDGEQIRAMLERVLRLPAVASKRYLTNKVCTTKTSLMAMKLAWNGFYFGLSLSNIFQL
jgi:hypothetical protein